MPAVSVIMNCYNSTKYLREAIDSVCAQTYDDWEIVFWDNLSTDGSDQIAKSYDGKLRYFVGEQFLPLGAARNEALKVAQGRYIAFLDCDDIWLPDKLERQVELLEQRSDVSLVYSDAYYIDEAGTTTSRHFVFSPAYRGWIFSHLLFENFIAFPTVILRQEILKEIGDFKPYKIAEEYDLFLRIAAKFQADYINAPLAKYRMHESNASKNFELALQETLDIYTYWESKNVIQQNRKLPQLFVKARAKAFLSAGKKAISFANDHISARRFYRLSFRNYFLAETFVFYLLSYLNPKVAIALKQQLGRAMMFVRQR